MRTNWTPDEICTLIEICEHRSSREIAGRLGRSVLSVENKVGRLRQRGALPHTPKATAWNDQDTRLLIELWPTHSASQIAARLHCSRSAVTAKASRLQQEGVLQRDVKKHFKVRPRKRLVAHAQHLPPSDQKQLSPPAPATLAMQPCTLLELESGRCHWPLGDPLAVASMFCGAAALPGRRYCDHHQRAASSPVRRAR